MTLGSIIVRENIVCMSIKACLTSLYTEPKNPRGMDSWKSKPLTMTRSPTVKLPWAMSLAAKTMIKLRAALKIACCPKFSAAKLVLVFKEAASYFFSEASYRSASNFSLLKY